jgi:hypothetical protein
MSTDNQSWRNGISPLIGSTPKLLILQEFSDIVFGTELWDNIPIVEEK